MIYGKEKSTYKLQNSYRFRNFVFGQMFIVYEVRQDNRRV